MYGEGSKPENEAKVAESIVPKNKTLFKKNQNLYITKMMKKRGYCERRKMLF
jgi:hypothetical protein